jgi:hypothetical protein
MVQAVLDNPIVQRSRSFGCARTVTRLCCSRGLPQDGASRGEMDVSSERLPQLEHLGTSSTAFVLISVLSVNQ